MRRTAILLGVAALVVAAWCSAAVAAPGGAHGSNPALLSPDQATALVNAPGQATVSDVHPVSAAQAAGAALAPGAVTAGIVTPVTTNLCWAGTIGYSWGTWPYQQEVDAHDYWCGQNYSSLYYRTVSITTSTTL